MTTTAKFRGSRGERQETQNDCRGEDATRRWFPDKVDVELRIDAIIREVEKRQSEAAQQLLFPIEHDAAPIQRLRPAKLLSEIVSRAYLSMFRALPEDHVVINPDANCEFVSRCRLHGASVPDLALNQTLLNLRKSGKHRGVERGIAPCLDREVFDKVGFAAEIAARLVQIQSLEAGGEKPTVDRILCDPILRQEFDNAVQGVAPGFSLYDYRLAAFAYRKSGRESSVRLGLTSAPAWDVDDAPFRTLDPDDAPGSPGIYRVDAGSRAIFLSATLNLRARLLAHLAAGDRQSLFPPSLWNQPKGQLVVRWFAAPAEWQARRTEAVAQRLKTEVKALYNLYSCCA